MALSRGSMKGIMGPPRPTLGAPASSTPKPPSPGTGVQPVWMKNAVMKPQAMNAAMFGMIIPDRKVPNFCTATLAPDCPAGAAVDALTGFPLDATTDGNRIVGCPAVVVGLRTPR